MKLRILLFIMLLSSFHFKSNAQEVDTLTRTLFVVENGDTIPMVMITPPKIVTFKFTSERQKRKYNRLTKRVVKVYPYAHAAGELMADFDEELMKIDSKKQQKKFMELAEEELKSQFESELKNMTISEGMILIKLIDRETGNTSYELLQDLKGNFSAFMWQGLARLFGHNLKNKFDPSDVEQDLMIEDIVDKIEMGVIEVEKKEVDAPTALMLEKSKLE